MTNDERIQIRYLMENSQLREAIEQLERVKSERTDDDEVLCELGSAYWKLQDWKLCLDNYSLAVGINPESPARELRQMVEQIIGFYNKDMYNP